jgi:RNA polymerase sigma-70 factor, ECF subfamily
MTSIRPAMSGETEARPAGATLHALPFAGSDADLVAALRRGSTQARAAFFDRHVAMVRRLLIRVMGPDPDLGDLLQEVFLRALEQIGKLEDPDRLRSWLASIAVFTARGEIRRRKRHAWLRTEADLPEVPIELDPESAQVLRLTYAALGKLDADERITFALRHIEGMELTEVAAACDVSLSTIKRRLARAQARFVAFAAQHPVLDERLEHTSWRRS